MTEMAYDIFQLFVRWKPITAYVMAMIKQLSIIMFKLNQIDWRLSASLKWCKRPWTWWRHQMETFSALLALCAGNSPVPMNSPHKGQRRGALMLSFIFVWINDWVNNREAGDLRRHRGHYGVNVMLFHPFSANFPSGVTYMCLRK